MSQLRMMLHQHCPGVKKRSEQFQIHRVGVSQGALTSGESDSPATLEVIAPSQARESATGFPP